MANEEDGIYTGASTDGLIQTNTRRHLMLDLTDSDQGYSGTFNVVVNASDLKWKSLYHPDCLGNRIDFGTATLP
jgi:hypothetical protein